MDRDIFNDWFSEEISGWIDESIAGAGTISITESTDSDAGNFFREIGSVVDLVEEFIADHDRRFTISACYSLLGTLIEYGIGNDLLAQKDQWQDIADLFYNRANEFVGDQQFVRLPNEDIDNVRLLKIVEYIVYNIEDQSARYSTDEFTPAEKVQMIRAIIIGLRNNRFIDKSPLLSKLFSLLATDWRVLGGGFGGNMGSGSNPWSSG